MHDVDKIQAAQIFGKRMREAREINLLTLSDAAKLFGYRNPSMLSKIENNNHRGKSNISILLVIKASGIYGVSIDFLFGLSEDWERDAQVSREREIASWMQSALEKKHIQELDEIRALNKRVDTVAQAVSASLEAINSVHDAMLIFRERNKRFNDMPCGSQLLYRVGEAYSAAMGSKAALNRLSLFIQSGGHSKVNMDLFNGPAN